MKYIYSALLIVVFTLFTHLLAPVTVFAAPNPTAKQCQTRYDGKTYSTTSLNKIKTGAGKSCFEPTVGSCLSEATSSQADTRKVSCSGIGHSNSEHTGRNPDGTTTPGPTAPTGVGTVSSTCQKKTDICVSSLPRPNTSGKFVENVLRIVLGIIAAIAVLFVALGGMRYILSQGDPQAVSKAKSTIVYALIGLAVALLAQAIVILVINVVSS